MNIKVTDCQDCPFANNDNSWGYDQCNINDNITTKAGQQLPKDKVHKDCPLKKGSYTVSTKEGETLDSIKSFTHWFNKHSLGNSIPEKMIDNYFNSDDK